MSERVSKVDLKTIRRDFSENTSCHGIGQLYASKSKWQRVFWCLLVVTVIGVLASQVTIRIRAYLAYETTTSITEKYNSTLEMPAITICNFNGFFNITKKEEFEAVRELAKAKSDISDGPIDYKKIAYFDGVSNGSVRGFAINKGWNLSESLMWCRFGLEDCTADNFTYTIGDMGKCWTYKAPFPIEKAGSRSGIHMVFDVKQDQYTEDYLHGRWEAGIKVQIHPVTTVPEVDELGLAVPVGSMGFIAINMVEENIMHQPWGECQPENEHLVFFETYNRANCFNECYKAALAEDCKCRMYYFKNPTDLRECNAKETADCLYNSSWFIKQVITPKICGCQPPCNDKRYISKISYGAFPNLAVQEAATKLWRNATTEYISANLVGIRVYYETLSYVKRHENKQITWSAMLSDLGGQLGLWIGISVVTFFEFAQFVVFHVGVLLQKARKWSGFQST